MDFHFVKPNTRGDKSGSDFKKSFKNLTAFLPLFLLALALPFMIALVIAPPDIGFFTRADTETELRVWIEPANLVMTEGTSADVTVFAQYDGDSKLIPEISLDITSSEQIELEETSLTRSIPFSGKVEIGKVTLLAKSKGTGKVIINDQSVVVTAFSDPLEIKTASANVIVR